MAVSIILNSIGIYCIDFFSEDFIRAFDTTYPLYRLHKFQKWVPLHRYQHIYMWLVYGLVNFGKIFIKWIDLINQAISLELLMNSSGCPIIPQEEGMLLKHPIFHRSLLNCVGFLGPWSFQVTYMVGIISSHIGCYTCVSLGKYDLPKILSD